MNRDSLYQIIDLRLNEVENNPYILTRIHNGHKIELVFSSKGLKVVNILAADSLPKANDIGFVRLVSNGKIESGDCDSLIGKMSWSDGLGTYEGEWENNLPHGKGYFKDQNNNWYKGEFKYGYLWGKGQMLVNGYYLYEGEFVMSRRQGTGNCKFYSPKNESYEGQWREDNMDGMGKYSKGPKHYYYGNLVKNKFSGTGKLTTPEGWMEGNFTDGLPNGYIKQYLSKDDAYIEGNWVRGKREGKFQVTNSTKQISFKTFSNDVELIDR